MIGSRALKYDDISDCYFGGEDHPKNLRPEKRRLKDIAEATALATIKKPQFSVYPIEIRPGRELRLVENGTIIPEAESLRDNSIDRENAGASGCMQTAQTNTLPGRSIPLHVLLESGSIVVGLACLSSLLSWIFNDSSLIIINPFAALLILIATPFFYLMGRASRK